MSTITLSVGSRTETGKGAARKMRFDGIVPGVVYREGREPTLITFNPKDISLAFEKTGNPNTLVDMTMGSDKFLCLVKEVQRHPVSGSIRHIDFYEVKIDEAIVVSVPLTTVGRAAGVAMGGTLRLIRRELSVRCLPADIPAIIEADVTELNIGKFLKVNQIPTPTGVQILFDSNAAYNIATVIKRRGGK